MRRLCDPHLALSMCICTYTPTELTRSFKTQQFQKFKVLILCFDQSHTDYFRVPLGIKKYIQTRY